MSLTPQRELRRWILAILLDEPGTAARRARVLEVMAQRYGARLTTEDHDAPSTRPFEENWRNRASYERADMVREGLLVADGRGDWQLTDAGIAAAQSVQTAAATDWAGSPPEVLDAEVLADEAAGRPPRRGLRLTASERKAIEGRAVDVVTLHFETLGYRVDNVGDRESFDLDVRRPGERIYVEVKGTTTSGSAIVLTRGEVDLHREKHPANALAVVHGISLDRTATPPAASGGDLVLFQPWAIDDSSLTPLSYKYMTGLGS